MLLTLEVIADICAGREMYQQAARLYGAADAARRRLGIGHNPVDSLRRRPFRDRAARALDPQTLRELLAEGSALSLDEAIDFASRARGVRDRPQAGWESLTGTELAVVRQLTDGLTNAAIAEKMLISQGTVKAHLSHIFSKTGVSSRAELAALAARHLGTPPHSGREPRLAGGHIGQAGYPVPLESPFVTFHEPVYTKLNRSLSPLLAERQMSATGRARMLASTASRRLIRTDRARRHLTRTGDRTAVRAPQCQGRCPP